MRLMERRAHAVAEAVAKARAVEASRGVTRQALADIKSILVGLASRAELFPAGHFRPDPETKAGTYRLSEDADHRFALYASTGLPGKKAMPHNHTTWAVIAGVRGDEHNTFYKRTDNRSRPGHGTLEKTGELTVTPGRAVGFLPDDFHTIEVTGDQPSLHLHMYGRSLEHLPERIAFAAADGGDYGVYPPGSRFFCPLVEAGELKAMLGDGRELALIDVREEGHFAEGHLLFACSLPLSRLEERIDALVPRRACAIVLTDGGDGLAHRAGARLMHLGYGTVSVLAGGLDAWAEAGFEVFGGLNVPSKAFGEFVKQTYGQPRLTADQLKAKADAGEDLVILDSRPMDEYRRMNIPGGIDCPGAELVHRVFDSVASPDTLVVVNCAGRTRGIIGGQALINAGIPNPVAVLEDGTMGWRLAGLALEEGRSRRAPEPSAEGLAKARAAAQRVARRFGVRTIDRAGLARFQGERESRSLYVFDVRGPEEYEAGHFRGSRSAPGGQLVQATDAYVGTRNARLVLIDDTGVRATMTASWLIQMGWDEVYVLEDALAEGPLAEGPEPVDVLGLADAGVETIGPAGLSEALDAGTAQVVDLDTSLAYRKAHIPGAWFAVRARLSESLKKVPRAELLVLTSADGTTARLAAADPGLSETPVKVLAGGTRAWAAAGLALASGDENMADAADDVWYRPVQRASGVEAAMRAYLAWETTLLAQVERDGDARFRAFPEG